MRVLHRTEEIAGLFAALAVLSGCGGNGSMSCNLTTEITVSPTSATVNHAAAPPANQTQFLGTAAPTAAAGCPVPQWIAREHPTWSNPDPTDIQISSTNDLTNGTAICKAPTAGPVTLTGTFTELVSSPVTRTVQLTCN